MALTMGLVFIGCGGNLGQVDATDADNILDTKGPGSPVWSLSEDVLPILGELETDQAGAGAALSGTPLQVAATGDNDTFSLEIKDDDEAGHLVVVINTGGNNWGAGLDVLHGTGAGKFTFLAGDTITVTGKALDWAEAEGNTGGDSWASSQIFIKLSGLDPPLDFTTDLEEDEPFELTYKLSAGDITKILSQTPYSIRVGARPKKVSFQITDIVVSRN
jgi:hypothetical protein